MSRPGAVLLTAVALLWSAAPAQGERWRRPLQGEVVGRFAYDREAPFERGRRRGIDVAARPGTPVRAACGGRVTFAGRPPGRAAAGVTVRCGALVATHLGLGALRVRRGARVVPGRVLGLLGAAGVLRLGARRAGDPAGYVDPAPLVRAAGPPPAVPLGRAPRRPPGAAPQRPGAAPPTVRPAPAPALARPAPARVPAAAWLGVAMLAAALGGALRVGAARRRAVPAGRGRARAGAVLARR